MTGRFLKENESLFVPETELFSEEWILYHRAMKSGYSTLYYPGIQVIHKCSASIKKDNEDLTERMIAMNKNMIKSRKVYIEATPAIIFDHRWGYIYEIRGKGNHGECI